MMSASPIGPATLSRDAWPAIEMLWLLNHFRITHAGDAVPDQQHRADGQEHQRHNHGRAALVRELDGGRNHLLADRAQLHRHEDAAVLRIGQQLV